MSWNSVALGTLCDIYTGKKDVNEGNENGTYPFFTCATKHTFSDVFSFDCEAILVAGNGAVGQTNYYKGKFEAYQRTYVLCNFKGIIPHYLLYFLNGNLMYELSFKVLGNTIPYIKKGMLTDFRIPLPPLPIQQKIVEKLDIIFAEIDKATAAVEANASSSDIFVRGAIEKLIRSLSRDCFIKFGDVCSFVRGPFGGTLKKSIFVDKGYAVYEQQHPINNQFDSFRYFVDDKKFNEMKRFEVFPHDLLMSCSGVILGKIAIVPKSAPKGIINQALLKITPNTGVSKDYLKIVMDSDYFQSILWDVSGGAAQPNVPSVKMIKDFLIPIPSVEEQKKFIDIVNSIRSYDLKNIYNKKKISLMSLRNSVLRRAFTGELVKAA